MTQTETLVMQILNRSPRTAGMLKSMLFTIAIEADEVDAALASLQSSEKIQKQNSGFWQSV